MEDIILLGIGGHAHSVIDSIEQGGKYHIVGFLESIDKQDDTYKDYKVIGTDDMLQKYYQEGIKNAFVTVGYMGEGNIRTRLYAKLKEIGYKLPNIIDETAILARDVCLGEGNFIGKRVVINANSKVGNMCIINTGAIIEHDCTVGNMTHIAVGATACGQVNIGSNTLIGANSVVRQCIHIGDNVIIGAGTVVVKNVPNNIKRYGNVEEYNEG